MYSFHSIQIKLKFDLYEEQYTVRKLIYGQIDYTVKKRLVEISYYKPNWTHIKKNWKNNKWKHQGFLN